MLAAVCSAPAWICAVALAMAPVRTQSPRGAQTFFLRVATSVAATLPASGTPSYLVITNVFLRPGVHCPIEIGPEEEALARVWESPGLGATNIEEVLSEGWNISATQVFGFEFPTEVNASYRVEMLVMDDGQRSALSLPDWRAVSPWIVGTGTNFVFRQGAVLQGAIYRVRKW